MSKETPQGVKTRFAASKIPFPMACSMGHAYNGTITSNTDPSRLLGYFPQLNFSSCATPTRELDVVFERMFNQASWRRPAPKAFYWCGGMECQITMGKYTALASSSLEEYVRYADFGEPPPRALKVKPKSDRWARHLDCVSDDAWECMFGVTMPSYEEISNKNEMAHANNLLHRRSCAFSNSCQDGMQWHLSQLMHGWLYRWTMPLNACDGARKSCNNNVLSNINLPAGTTNRVFLSIHMRMGDACDVVETTQRFTKASWGGGEQSRPCIAPKGYEVAVKEFSKLYGVTDILLGSDSDEAIQWAKEQTSYDVHWLDSNRSKLMSPYSNVSSGSTLNDKWKKGWIENRDDIGWTEVEGALEEFDFLAHGQLFIGNMGSFYSRAVYRFMIGRQNVVAPYISIDGWPLGAKWYPGMCTQNCLK
eukprot:CAMPEP_0172308402 /NCGR_PEP_ID=MMETSP1058-20130122/9004_1 /TAXON_ID=83371 /ORGANISM="Detonula confervacea, Strain CCMP 353" /LENGTH=419 /DNA_ID=CAMNT_0013020809 /DNA_START=246 /DNA_END=1505 /DNA_ORIENTATION=+